MADGVRCNRFRRYEEPSAKTAENYSEMAAAKSLQSFLFKRSSKLLEGPTKDQRTKLLLLSMRPMTHQWVAGRLGALASRDVSDFIFLLISFGNPRP